MRPLPISLTDLRARRDLILRLAELYRVQNVRVFGSVVRGQRLEPWSDVDFMVDPLPGHSLLDRAGLVIALGELLDTAVDVVTEREMKRDVHDRAVAEAVGL